MKDQQSAAVTSDINIIEAEDTVRPRRSRADTRLLGQCEWSRNLTEDEVSVGGNKITGVIAQEARAPASAPGEPDATSRRLARLKARRKLWLDVHLYLGLFAGAVLVLIGLTGSILVFWQEIDELLNPVLMTVEAQKGGETAFRHFSEITTAADAAMPPGSKLVFGYYPRNERAAFHLFYQVPHALKTAPEAFDQYHVFVNPYTAEVTGKRLVRLADSAFPRTFIRSIFELHWALLLGGNGSIAVGIIAVLLIISVLTGLIVWWPITGKWRQALTMSRGARGQRLIFDLHKTFGFYSALVLVAVLFSGVYFNLRDHVITLVRLFSPVTDQYAIRSEPQQGRAPIALAEAVTIVNDHSPGGRLDWLYGAPTPEAAYTVCKRDLPTLRRFVNDRRCVVVDQYSGRILHVEDVVSGTTGEAFLAWQWPLHSGRAFGMTGRILVFLTGLACPVLYFTGVIRWLRKRRARQQPVHRTKEPHVWSSPGRLAYDRNELVTSEHALSQAAALQHDGTTQFNAYDAPAPPPQDLSNGSGMSPADTKGMRIGEAANG